MKTKFLFIYLFLGCINIFAQKENCKIIFHLKNIDTLYSASIISINDMTVLYQDTIGKMLDSFSVKIAEPMAVFFVVNEDPNRLIWFWIDTGITELFIDAFDVRKKSIINSSINNQSSKYIKSLDSIYTNSFEMKKIADLRKMDTLNLKKDSIDRLVINLANDIYYKEGFNNLKSFFTLNNIYQWLQEVIQQKEQAYFSQQKLKRLFDKLDKNMKKYPTYKKCLEMFKSKIENYPKINNALYKIDESVYGN